MKGARLRSRSKKTMEEEQVNGRSRSPHTSQICPQKRDMEKGKPNSAPQHQTQQAEGLPAKEGRNRKGRLKKEKSLGGKAC